MNCKRHKGQRASILASDTQAACGMGAKIDREFTHPATAGKISCSKCQLPDSDTDRLCALHPSLVVAIGIGILFLAACAASQLDVTAPAPAYEPEALPAEGAATPVATPRHAGQRAKPPEPTPPPEEEPPPPPPPPNEPTEFTIEEPTPPPRPSPTEIPKESASESIPQFPFPPPMASAFEIISRELLVGPRPDALLKDAEAALNSAFLRCGYGEKSYYAVPDGFAMASRLEHMNEDGTPHSDRWSTEVTPMQKFTLDAYFKALFKARSGYYRVIVFIVTTHPFRQTSAKPTSREASLWVSEGLNTLPKEIGHQAYSTDYTCTALIYEFKRMGDGKVEFVEPSQITGRTHLEKAGLLAAFERPK